MKRGISGLLVVILLVTPALADQPPGLGGRSSSRAATKSMDMSAEQGVVVEKATLNALIQEALKNNSRLKAAHYRAQAAQARTSLWRDIPDPMLEYEHDRILPSMVMSGDGKVTPMKSLTVLQTMPFPTKIFMRKKAAQKEADALDQEYKETERAVIKDVKEAYAGLYLNRRKVDFFKDLLSLLGQFVEVINKKYSVNKAAQPEVLRAQVEFSRMSNMVLLSEQQARIAESLLVALIGRNEDSSLVIAEVDPVDDLLLKESDIVTLARKHRPELRSVRAMLERSGIESSLAKQEFLPDISLKYKRQEQDGSFRDGAWAGMVGINVPLWSLAKQLPLIREARANFEAAKAEYKSAEDLAVFEARSAFAKFEAARQLVAIYETGVLPQATSAVTTARRAYESGSLSFLELLDSIRMLRDLEVEYFDSVAELQIAWADLERSIGSDL